MATTNKVDIWNKALFRIGETVKIEDEADTTTAAVTCQLFYDDCVKETLEGFPWPFATKRVALAKLATVTRTGWGYVYALPTDCVMPLAILIEDQRRSMTTAAGRWPFDIQLNDTDDGQVLCCDLDEDEWEAFEYVAFVEVVAAYPAQFVDALAWRLAAELALALPKDKQLAAGCLKSFETSVSRAAANAFRGRQEDLEPEADSIRVRY